MRSRIRLTQSRIFFNKLPCNISPFGLKIIIYVIFFVEDINRSIYPFYLNKLRKKNIRCFYLLKSKGNDTLSIFNKFKGWYHPFFTVKNDEKGVLVKKI